MSSHIKPILQAGFKINEHVSIDRRVEKVFFTEVYRLTDDSYLYLFLNLKPNQIIHHRKHYEIIKIRQSNIEYLAVITSHHSHETVTRIIEDCTVPKGFNCVAGMEPLKHLLLSDVIQPLLEPEKFEKFKLSIPNGILFLPSFRKI